MCLMTPIEPVLTGAIEMKTHAGIAIVLCLTFVASPSALPGEWSDVFDLPGLSGRVFALGDWRGQVIAGGQEFHADGRTLGHLATFDGQLWQPFGRGLTGDVRDMVTYQGDLIVAGFFSTADGTIPQGGIISYGVARWDGTDWSRLGDGLDLSWSYTPRVWALAVYQGELYAAGQIDRSGSRSVAGIARWNGSQWIEVGGGIHGSYEPKVLDLFVTSDDRLIVAGEFDSAGGLAARNIAAWNGSSWSTLGNGVNQDFASVFAVEEYAGKLYIAGNFNGFAGPGTKEVAAWNGSSWEALGNGIPDWDIGVTAYALEVFDGRLHVGGNFHGIDGQPASRIASWDGSTWHGLGGVSGQDLKTTVIAMHAFQDRLWVGGEFTRAGEQTAGQAAVVSQDLVTWDGGRWQQAGHGLGFDIEVYDLVAWNGGVVAVGRFIEAGGSQASRVARFDGNDWQRLGDTNGNVHEAMVYQGDLIITGDFTSVSGVATGALARHDGAGWTAMGGGAGGSALGTFGGQLYAGGLGGVRRWNGSSWEAFGETIFGIVECLQEYNGRLYIGGSFAGAASANITSWDGNSMIGLGSGTNGIVEAMIVHQGQLLVGGRFTQVDGQPARIMALWDGNGWTPFDTGITGFTAECFALLGGDLYAGGDLMYGRNSARDSVARWNGAAWEALDQGVDGYPFALLADEANQQLWVGGWFYDASGNPSWNVARWDRQAVEGSAAWDDLSRGLLGATGIPSLRGSGTLVPGTSVGLDLTGAAANAPAFVVAGPAAALAPFRGGILVPTPTLLSGQFTDPSGEVHLQDSWPTGIPSGSTSFWQVWIADPGAPRGLSASNALRSRTP